jgi:hypothetical protein
MVFNHSALAIIGNSVFQIGSVFGFNCLIKPVYLRQR